MKGLELSQRFFEEVGFPAIREHLPECVSHITVGLSGGAQSHGNDDEIFRDHGWGASFMVRYWMKPINSLQKSYELYLMICRESFWDIGGIAR